MADTGSGNVTAEENNLGFGGCTNIDLQKGITDNPDCTGKKTNLPNGGGVNANAIKGVSGYMSTNSGDYMDTVEAAANNPNGVDSSGFGRNAKKAQKAVNKLLKLKNKKGITKDKKGKKIKPLHKTIMTAMKDRMNKINNILSSIADQMKESGIAPANAAIKDPGKKYSKRSVFDDKKVKRPSYNIDDEMGDEEDLGIEGDSEEVDYSQLEDYEDTAEDIVDNKSASLFKVISVRYKKSAWDDLLPKLQTIKK
ncbi:MAG: hypothetical protein CME61_02260 [Halobacteriovoraceae bacterium]|nr:hypothetical protein [Halobacteriovoraceae bacterium]